MMKRVDVAAVPCAFYGGSGMEPSHLMNPKSSWRTNGVLGFSVSFFLGIILCAAICGLGALNGRAAAAIEDIIRDTQRMRPGKSGMRMVWWIPYEYWEVSFANAADLTEKQRSNVLKVLSEYAIFLVVDCEFKPDGQLLHKTRSQMLESFSVALDGKNAKVLNLEDMTDDMQSFLTTMKPLMAKMLGNFGRGLQFFAIENGKKNGKKMLNSTGKGVLSCSLSDEQFRWRLPLGSLMPKKKDPTTQEEFPGDYIFSPYTGEKLEIK